VLKFIFQFDQWTEQNVVMLLCASADWLTNMLKHNYTATPENAEIMVLKLIYQVALCCQCKIQWPERNVVMLLCASAD
jgi:hypothetical protein